MDFRHFRGKRPPRFAHDSERELAELLDAAGPPWEYEPRTFPLVHAEDGRLLEAVTPDFYLPEADLYIDAPRCGRSWRTASGASCGSCARSTARS